MMPGMVKQTMVGLISPMKEDILKLTHRQKAMEVDVHKLRREVKASRLARESSRTPSRASRRPLETLRFDPRRMELNSRRRRRRRAHQGPDASHIGPTSEHSARPQPSAGRPNFPSRPAGSTRRQSTTSSTTTIRTAFGWTLCPTSPAGALSSAWSSPTAPSQPPLPRFFGTTRFGFRRPGSPRSSCASVPLGTRRRSSRKGVLRRTCTKPSTPGRRRAP